MRVRSVTCKGCGGRAKIPHGEQAAVCLQCGQEVRLSDAVLEEQNRGRMFPPGTPLRLGMKATWKGRQYEATGRQVMRQVAEGVTYQWEEWVLISPDGDLLYLEYDEGKWKLSEPFVPSNPVLGQTLATVGTGRVLNLDGHGAMVTDTGNMRVVHVEGEFPWLASVDRTSQFVDLTSGKTIYSIERTPDAIEYYRGEYLDPRQVYSMFGMHKLLAELDRREAVLRSRRHFGLVLLGASLVAFVVWIVALASPGRMVPGANGSIRLDAASFTPLGTPGVPGQKQLSEEGIRYGPFALSGAGRVYRLDINGQMRESSTWVAAVLEDEDELELVPVDKDMWDESGYDDGYWHESDLHASTYFVIRKPGNYYVRLYAEGDPGKPAAAAASFTLREQVMFPSWLGWYALLGTLVGVCFLGAGAPDTTKQLWQSLQSSDD